MGIKIELERLPPWWSNGVTKAYILGDWTVIPRVGDSISLENIYCEGHVRSVTWVAPDHVIVVVEEPTTRVDPKEESKNG